MFEQLNGKQVAVAVCSALAFIAAASSQLEPMIGHAAAVGVSSGAAFLGGLTAAILAPFMGNASVVRDASDVNGARVVINRNAPQSIAALATDPTAPYIEAEKGQEAAVAKIAQGAD